MTCAEWLVQRRACDEGREWAGDRDLRAVWEECPRSDWLLWLLEQLGYRDERVLRLYACWCVRQVWHILPESGPSRNAVEVAERYAGGDATKEELAAARAAVCAAARDAASATASAAAWAAASDVASDAARAATWAAAWDAALRAQADYLREVIPFAEVQALYEASLEVRDERLPGPGNASAGPGPVRVVTGPA